MKTSLGAFIAKLRKEKGLTQKQLAEILGVSDKTVSHWEREESSPDISLLKEIATVFGITTDELLSGEKIVVQNDPQAISETIEKAWGAGENTNRLVAEKYIHDFTNKNIICAAVSILALICGFIVLYLENGYSDGATAVLLIILVANLCAVFVFRGNFSRILSIAQLEDEALTSLRQRANRITALSCYLILLVSSFSFYFLANISAALFFALVDCAIIFLAEILLRKKDILKPKGYSKKVKRLFLLSIITVPLVCLLIFLGFFLQETFDSDYIIKKNAEALYFSTADEFKAFMLEDIPESEHSLKSDEFYDYFTLREELDGEEYGFVWYKENGELNLVDFKWNNKDVCKIISHKELPIEVYTYGALEKSKNENLALLNSLNFIYAAYYITVLLMAVFVYIALTRKICKRYSQQ